MSATGARYAVLVPVKPPARGKTRLTAQGLPRADLARAFALDTVAAVLACPPVSAVLAVTDDFAFAAELRELGCEVIPDGVSGDLNGTLVQAAAEAARRWPDCGVAAVCGDLPALRSHELAAALDAAPASGAAFVADHATTGTTLYVARPLQDFSPRFGHGSAALHRGAGAEELTGEWPSLRLDVDEPGDLGRALLLGVGPATRAASGR